MKNVLFLTYIFSCYTIYEKPFIEEIYYEPLKNNDIELAKEILYNDMNTTNSNLNKDNNFPQYSNSNNLNINFKENKCFVLWIDGDKNIENKINTSDIKLKYSKFFNGYSFCTYNQQSIIDLKQIPGILLEPDHYYYTSGTSVQIDPPQHMFYMMNYRNKYIGNGFFNRFKIFKYIYKFFYSFYKYEYTGKNVYIYLLDTDVDILNRDIKGRAENVFKDSLYQNGSENIQYKENKSGNFLYCNNHGTNVAVLVAGRVNGFAKESNIFVLNVLDCEGKARLSTILKALESIKNTYKTNILILPISGPKSEIFNKVVNKLEEYNVIVITSAGNNADLSCNYSPGSAEKSINVGSLDINSKISKFSNFGGCVRLYSLGEEIISQSSRNDDTEGNDKKSNILTGTSFSAALVSGSVALFLEMKPNAKFDDIWHYLVDNSDMEKGAYLVQKIPDFKTMQGERVTLANDKSMGILSTLFCMLIIISFIFIFIVFFKKKRENRYRF